MKLSPTERIASADPTYTNKFLEGGGVHCTEALTAQPLAIYGDDTRSYSCDCDITYSEQMSPVNSLCNRIAGIISSKFLIKKGKNYKWNVPSLKESLKDRYGATYNGKFAEDPTPCQATAFLVGKDLVLTAGHCINESNFKKLKLVFGLQMAQPTTAKKFNKQKLLATRVYEIIEVISLNTFREPGAERVQDVDWSLCKINRSVEDVDPLEIGEDEDLAISKKICTIGHPDGLLLQISSGAISAISDQIFFSPITGFKGTSGSPAIDLLTGKILGIAIRGFLDYNVEQNTLSAKKYEINGNAHHGARFQKIGFLRDAIRQYTERDLNSFKKSIKRGISEYTRIHDSSSSTTTSEKGKTKTKPGCCSTGSISLEFHAEKGKKRAEKFESKLEEVRTKEGAKKFLIDLYNGGGKFYNESLKPIIGTEIIKMKKRKEGSLSTTTQVDLSTEESANAKKPKKVLEVVSLFFENSLANLTNTEGKILQKIVNEQRGLAAISADIVM